MTLHHNELQVRGRGVIDERAAVLGTVTNPSLRRRISTILDSKDERALQKPRFCAGAPREAESVQRSIRRSGAAKIKLARYFQASSSEPSSTSDRSQGCLQPETGKALITHTVALYVKWLNVSWAVRAPIKREGCPIARLL
jgi:hypothetical protein